MATKPNSTPEYLTLRKSYKALVAHIKVQLGCICDSLFEQGHVSEEVCDYVGTDAIPDGKKARKLVNALMKKVEFECRIYHDFLSILKDEGPSSDYIVQQLEECYSSELAAFVEYNCESSDDSDTSVGNKSKVFEKSVEHQRKPNTSYPRFICPFCKKCTVIQFFSKDGCPKAGQHDIAKGDSLFPYLDYSGLTKKESLVLECQLIDDTKNMVCSFAETEDKLIVSLESQELSVSRLRNYAGNFVKKIGTKEELEKLQKSENLYDVFFALHPFKSFFHYEIVENIVKRFGSGEDQHLMEDYVSKFNDFCRRSVFEVPPNVFHDSDPKPGDKVFSVKFTPEERASLGDIVAVRRKMANILGIDVYALQLCCVTDGCVCLRFLISAQMAQNVSSLSQNQLRALNDIHVRVLKDFSPLEEEELIRKPSLIKENKEEAKLADFEPPTVEASQEDAQATISHLKQKLMDQMNSSPLASEGTVEALRGGRGDSAEHSGNHGRGSRQQQSRGRTHNTAAISERPGFIKDDIEKLALATEADEETVIICITRSEYEFIKAFKQNSFLKTKKVLKQLVAILFKLAKSVDSQAALRILAQLFGSSGEHATFLFYLQQLISEMPSERRAFIKEENLQALYHLTEIGKFCFEKIPGTVQNTFPVQYIQSTTESLIKYSTGSDTARVTLEDIEENMVELQVQRLSFAEEQARPKPKPVRVFGDVEKEPPEDFATLPILPTPDEINLYAKKPYLRPNIIKGTYRNWGHYLDIQFRLLREDFVGPLREGIADHLQNPTLKGGEVRVYRNVRIQQPVCLAMGIGFEVSFDMRSLRRVNWEYTKRLINGSLLCLSTDDFKTIAFASVAQREKEKLEKGIVTVKFEGSVSGFALNPQAQCTMVESVAYLEAYRHVLKKLQSVSEEHEIDLMPFKRYIVECTYTDIPIPRYLNHFGHTVFDLQGVIEIKGKFVSSRVDLTNSTSFPDSSITDLDSSQMRALKAALTQEISVIQGPPGTGKTYVGMKIVKAFLANREVWDPLKTTPILVVCYTNHALDQFLEGIRCDKIQRKAPNVTRIGGRCKSKILTECTLHEKVSKARAEKNVPRAEYKEYAEARREMVAHKDQIVKYLESIHISNKKILRIDRLRSIILEDHYFQLVSIVYTDNPMELWLGLLYEDPNDQSTQTATTPEQPVLIPQEIHDYSEALQLLEDSMEEDENTEVRMLQDDRLVEGTEVVYKASDNDQELPDEDPPKQKDNGGWQTVQMDEKKKKKLIYKQLSGGLKPMTDNEVDDVIDVWSLGKTERWKLYLYWREKYISFLRQQLERISGGYKFACDDFQQAKQRMDLTVIQGSDVVGMTTTGAAKHSYIIKSIRPKIVIIEEAAEIFEPHIFISLSPTVQQLILIGDHQQLPPKPTYFELEKNYNFNVSLFERLATNKCPVQTLNIQHRMRPEVASLITPAIYKELYNHESVKNYGHVQGVGKDLFFISHTEHEVAGADDRKSHSNPHEAKYIGALCDYLLKQGYKPAEITILTLYRGQLLEIKKTLRLRKISGVRSAVVDDFQGEENQIILLSLVRSNNDQKIGFVGIENRICVSLSRAKKGLYIIGNVQMLRTNVKTVWPKVIEQLTSMGSIGDSLPLHCHLHPDHKVNARTAEDFLKCPEGGCQQKCDARLPCGHVCRRMCHPYDIDHLEYKCLQKCSKRLPCGHQCKRKCHECSEGCKPCKERVTKILPTCGHSQKCNCCDSPLLLKCSRICERSLVCGHCCQQKCSEPCTTKCSVLVDKHLTCGHTVQDFCYLKEEHVECTELCDALLDCEHPCPGTCHSCKMGRLHTRCTAECGRTLTCGHICEFPCTPSCPPCSKRCRNYCNHSRCPKMCYEPCAPCMEPCDWSCDHFQCTQPCGMPCDRPPCNRPCKKFLKCGHRCIGLCGELCPKQCRVCDKDVVTEILFGNEDEKDARFILLPDCKHIIEVEGLDQWMSTESSNDDDESEEVTLKVCPKCKKPVRRCLRYGNNIRSKLEDVEAVKRKQLSTIQSINLPAELYKMRTSLRKTSSQSSRLVSEDLDIIERAIAKEQASANKTTFLFPHVLKAKLSFLLQIAMTYEIFNTAERSLVFSYDDRISKIKRNLNQLKVFIMQDFLSQQQLSDAEAEMRRLTLLAKLTELQVKLVPKRHQVSPSDNDLIQQCVKELEESGWKRKKVSAETEQQILCQIKSFRANYSIDKLSETERLEIVKAIGLSPGHWYKCPNGHYYAIGECGGAMQRGRCPECKADIGGMSHAIAAGNVHAPEMDGSRHAAWSDAANMENFDLQDLI